MALRPLLLAALLAALPHARADDDAAGPRAALLERLKAPENAVAKDWPGMPDRTLVAWTQLRPDPDGPSDLVDLTLLLVQTSTGRTLARARLSAAWESDAIAYRGLSFDTAAWTLAAGQRAFGVRANFVHPGRTTGIERTSLDLFEVRGATIVPVLSRLLVDERVESGQCGAYRERHATLGVAPTRSRGHADLALEADGMDATDGPVEADGPCKDAVQRHWHGVLRFDGTRYVVPPSVDGLP